MGLVDFFEKRYKKLRKLKNTITETRGKWHKRRPSIFKRKIDLSESINNSYKYRDGNVIYEKILRLIEDTGIDVRRSLTTDLMYDNDIFEDNYKKYQKTDFIYLAPGFKSKKFQTNNFENVLWLSGIVKEIFDEIEFGKFKLTEAIVDYTAQARRDKRVPDKSLPTTKTLLDKGKKYYEMVEKETEINKMALFGILGAFWSEMAWAFESKDSQINKQEMHGDKSEEEQKELNNGTVNANVVTGTTGASGCGEGWFGLTFWSQKQIIIRELKKLKSAGKLNDPVIDELKESEDATTGYGSNGKMLAHCSDETWCKICEIYMKKCAVTSGKVLLSDAEDPDIEELMCASFLWKAGDGEAYKKGLNMDTVEDVVQMYITSHEKQNRANNPNYKAKNGFAHMIYAGIMLALYMDTNEVPTIEEVDKLIGV